MIDKELIQKEAHYNYDDDKEWEAFITGAKWADAIITNGKQLEILEYCNGHTNQMWAANIVGIILECDFRDAREKLRDYLSKDDV